ncbi:hypothetical protein COO60DRAFT_1625670 [Scenedesmus sp. NREL 46B-D3]|nr:hypothetical protein COO60DRAFT_1625670 [Scenedesmus sp. NREL 46B-D3]
MLQECHFSISMLFILSMIGICCSMVMLPSGLLAHSSSQHTHHTTRVRCTVPALLGGAVPHHVSRLWPCSPGGDRGAPSTLFRLWIRESASLCMPSTNLSAT